MTYQPIFIIGAGRSGTNILRDTLTSLPSWETWDCDEINLIWRHGNIDMPHDVFGAEQARPDVVTFMHKEFSKFQKASGAKTIVEKTCSNSLRVKFLNAIFPNARYVYIVRDGRDVALSAAKRWTASVELGYLAKKVRYVPLQDIPHYGWRFISNRLHQMRSKDNKQAAWGPRFPDMNDWVSSKPLIETCAKQWAVCVEESDAAFVDMNSQKLFKVKYEELVSDPGHFIGTLCDWAGPDLKQKLPNDALAKIHSGSTHGWMKKSEQLTPEALAIMQPILERHGY